MSRVLSDTALRRGAALTLVAVTTTFAGCGDGAPTASTPVAAPTTATTSSSGSSSADKAAMAKEIRHVRSALKTAGYKLEPAGDASATNGSIRLDGATIFLFASEQSATDAERQIKAAYKTNGRKAAVARDGANVFIVRAESGLSKAEAALQKLQRAAAA